MHISEVFRFKLGTFRVSMKLLMNLLRFAFPCYLYWTLSSDWRKIYFSHCLGRSNYSLLVVFDLLFVNFNSCFSCDQHLIFAKNEFMGHSKLKWRIVIFCGLKQILKLQGNWVIIYPLNGLYLKLNERGAFISLYAILQIRIGIK